jgi:predicted RNA-binding Zn-ribbon protein involved in translation (DUF1610 family)
MMEIVYCENCKKVRFVSVSGNKYQCTECGNIFEIKDQ